VQYSTMQRQHRENITVIITTLKQKHRICYVRQICHTHCIVSHNSHVQNVVINAALPFEAARALTELRFLLITSYFALAKNENAEFM